MSRYMPHSVRHGMRFGLLVIEKFAGRYVGGAPVYRCLCDCGRTVEKSYDRLNYRASCGCVDPKMIRYLPDMLIGKRFGHLVVREAFVGKSLSDSRFVCECARCGRRKETTWKNLSVNRATSCGCLSGLIVTDSATTDEDRERAEAKRAARTKKAARAAAKPAEPKPPVDTVRCAVVEGPEFSFVQDRIGREDVPRSMRVNNGPTIYRLWAVWSRINRPKVVCPAWESFDKFKDWSLLSGFSAGAKLVRRDLSKPFHPSNCYWEKV